MNYEEIDVDFLNKSIGNLVDDNYKPKSLDQIKKGNSFPFGTEKDK